jgi:DNA primase
VGDTLDPRDFTIETVPSRLQRIGDIWAREMKNRNPIRTLLETGTGKPKSRR